MSEKTSPLVPRGLQVATAWTWRLLLIAFGVFALLFLLHKFLLVTLPLFFGLLLASLGLPLVERLVKWRVPRSLAAATTLLSGMGIIGLLIFFVVQQIGANIEELTDQVSAAIATIKAWLIEGPLELSDSQWTQFLTQVQEYVQTEPDKYIAKAGEATYIAFELMAGTLITAFVVFFFLEDGARIWRWAVSVFPKESQNKVDLCGQAIWKTLTKYTRAQLLVAAANSFGVMLLALILGLPLIVPLGVIVFLTSFIPLIGILLAGILGAALALVSQGPAAAVIMVVGTIVAHELEGKFLQPLIMGRFVAMHPLAILFSVTGGFLLAGIPGALVAVPLVASANSACRVLISDEENLTPLCSEEQPSPEA